MELLIHCLLANPKTLTDKKAKEKMNDLKIPKALIWTLPNGTKREVHSGDILLGTNGKTFFVTDWNEVTGYVHGVSTCEKHYFVKQRIKDLNCHFTEV